MAEKKDKTVFNCRAVHYCIDKTDSSCAFYSVEGTKTNCKFSHKDKCASSKARNFADRMAYFQNAHYAKGLKRLPWNEKEKKVLDFINGGAI